MTVIFRCAPSFLFFFYFFFKTSYISIQFTLYSLNSYKMLKAKKLFTQINYKRFNVHGQFIMKPFIIYENRLILLWQITFFLVIFGDIWRYLPGSDDFVLFVSLDGNGALFSKLSCDIPILHTSYIWNFQSGNITNVVNSSDQLKGWIKYGNFFTLVCEFM